jgi:hypothetical protein
LARIIAMSGNGRYVIITPYYQEPPAMLERCIGSVRRQSVPTEHVVIADGFPQAWIDQAGVRHIKLDRSHGDFGDTPRGVGALLAIAEEYDAIGLLDADNWLETDHVEACLAAARSLPMPCDYVIAQRTLRRPDESIMPIAEEDGHVDTSSFFFLPGAFSVIPLWAMCPKVLSPICDRYFYKVISRRPLVAARVNRPTVNYHCLWISCYEALGETPPPGAKPNVDTGPIADWLMAQNGRAIEIVARLSGLPFSDLMQIAGMPTQNGRNSPCPCGSGLRFKHCHGALA